MTPCPFFLQPAVSRRNFSSIQSVICFLVALAAMMGFITMGHTADFTERFNGPLGERWTGVPAGNTDPNGSITLYGTGEGSRLTTIPQFQGGKYTVELKISGMALNNYGYFGFFSRAPWAANALIGFMNGDRITFQSRRDSGEVAQPFTTPVITPDVWHTLTIDWTAKSAEMVWDGVSCGIFDRADLLPTGPLPAIIDVTGDGPGFKVEVRAVDIKDAATATPATTGTGAGVIAPPPPAVDNAASLPPVRRPADTKTLKMPAPTAPVAKRTGNMLSVSNAFYDAQLAVGQSLHLSALKNKVSGLSCLVPGARSEFFTIVSDGEVLRSSDFTVTKVGQAKLDTKQDKGGTRFEIVAENKAKAWEVEFSLIADASPEMRLGLQVRSLSPQSRKATLYWPHVTGLQIGANAEDNYYFFPWQGGWSNNRPYQLGAVYGNSTGLMQLFSLFNPAEGSSVYTYLKDDSGLSKTAVMRKDDAGQGKTPSYVPLYPQDQPEAGSLITEVGTQFALKPEAFTFEPRQSRQSPEVVLGISPGDWHQPLKSYSRWAHTWMKDPSIPAWYRSTFESVAVHDIGGNKGFDNGFLGDGKWALADRAQSDDDMLEVAYWWQHITLPEGTPSRAKILNRLAIGDYDYWKELGGAEQLRREIAESHKKGVRVNLYTTPRFVWHDSEVRKKNPDWVLIGPDGNVGQDWTATIEGVTMRMDDMCYGVPEWRKYISETVGRIVRDTGTDGVFMDTMNDAKRCFNPAHSHPESPSFMAEAMLKDYRKELKAANPQAVMTAEDVCSERLMQYIDGSLLKSFNGSEALYGEFDLYSIHFVRFYFPEIKYIEWGAKFEIGARRAFFNGMGYMRGDLGPSKDPFTGSYLLSSEQQAYLKMTNRIMKENVDAFDSRTPEPLVPTLTSGIYANKFPGSGQTVWTLYNRTGKDVDTNVISIPHVQGTTYVELVHGKTMKPTIENGVATIKLSMRNGEVLALAQRAPGFKVKVRGPIQSLRQAAVPATTKTR